VIPVDRQGIDYWAFGGRLRSQLEFPDLSPAAGREPPDLELRVSPTAPPVSIELVGTREIEPGWAFRLHRVTDGLRLDYGRTGSYGIRADGREIVWYTPPDCDLEPDYLLELVRAILLGPAMALALHQRGILCLHGSAVTIGSEAVAFLAPKHFGKSTIALALTASGARLMTDDLVAIEVRSSPAVLPGVHSLRLTARMAERMADRFSTATIREGYKKTLTDLPPERLAWSPAPLAAVYVLEPAGALADASAVSRARLSRGQAATALAHEKKLTDGLVGYPAAGSMLKWIAKVVSATPTYRLTVVRDLARLPEVVRQVMAWHGSAPGTPALEGWES